MNNETTTLQIFKPIIDEAADKYPGYNMLKQLDLYANLYCQIYTFNSDEAIKQKALRKLVIAQNLLSYFSEGRN